MQATKNKSTKRYQLRFRDSNGTQQQFSSKKDFPAGLSQRKANLIAEDIYQLHEEALKTVARPLLKDCVDRMLTHIENSGAKGMKTYRTHARMALTYDNNNTIDDVVKVCNQMHDDMLSKNYSGNTIYQRMYILKRTAKLAYERWDILDLPLTGKMPNPKKPKPRKRYLSIEECGLLLKCCDDDQTRYILELYALTGIRHAELDRMKDGDIFNQRITIDGKNGEARSFAISESAAEVAKKIIFPVTRNYDELLRHFTKARKKAKLVDFRMHDLRHTFASWLAQSGVVSIHQIQHVLGHKTIGQTMNYAHLMPENLDNVATILKVG